MSAFVYQSCAAWLPVPVHGLGAALLIAIGGLQFRSRETRSPR